MLESLKPRTCLLDIYGISSQYFDTSLKLLLFLTKFNRAELVAFAFSDYNFAENQKSGLPGLLLFGCMPKSNMALSKLFQKIKPEDYIKLCNTVLHESSDFLFPLLI